MSDFQTSDEEAAFRAALPAALHRPLREGPIYDPRAIWVKARKYFGGDKARSEEKPSVKNDHSTIRRNEAIEALPHWYFSGLPVAPAHASLRELPLSTEGAKNVMCSRETARALLQEFESLTEQFRVAVARTARDLEKGEG